MPKVFESMTKIGTGAYTIRIWREESHLPPNGYTFHDTTSLQMDVLNWLSAKGHRFQVKDLATFITALPRVNAVEITDTDSGKGLLIYPEWP